MTYGERLFHKISFIIVVIILQCSFTPFLFCLGRYVGIVGGALYVGRAFSR